MKLIKMIRYGKTFLFLGILFGLFSFSSCSENLSYEEYVAVELSKGVYHDSLIYRIRFGMTYEEFDSYCLAMNKKKIFMPSHNGSAVRLRLQDGFDAPVYFDFFPTASVNKNISKLIASMTYQNFSYYDKKYEIDNLVPEAIAFFEKGYGGNEFFAIPHENKLLKYMYVKIDGNRKIILSPSFDGQMLNIVFENLTPGFKNIIVE
jgi:hypothetical protein